MVMSERLSQELSTHADTQNHLITFCSVGSHPFFILVAINIYYILNATSVCIKMDALIWVGYQYGIDVYMVCLILGVYEHWYDVFIAHHT
jgi:hypothetical protein